MARGPLSSRISTWPSHLLPLISSLLAKLGGVPEAPTVRGAQCQLEGVICAAKVHALQEALPALTRGEGVLESAFDGYQPVRGPVPMRPRTDHNPLDRREYIRHVQRRQ